MQKYYKLVRSEISGLYSYYASGVLDTMYSPNEWVYASKPAFNMGYGLFVFNEEGIKLFVEASPLAFNEDSLLKIWECEIGETYNTPKFRIDRGGFPRSYEDIVKTFTFPKNDIFDREHWTSDWPYGTIMTDKVKLVKKCEVKDGTLSV